MPPVLIYSTPGCAACRITTAQFDKNGIQYETVALAESPERARDFAQHGYSQAPVVMVPEDPAYGAAAGAHWSGLQPDMIQALITA
jgi:glutaredoxin-like protein NrdH